MLKFQYFGHLMQRTDSLEKILMLGKIEGGRRRGQQRIRWLDGITITRWAWVWVNSGRWWWTGRPGVLQSMGSQRVGHAWATELNWTELNALLEIISPYQSTIVFLFMLSSDAILCHLLNLLQITYCTTLHDLVKDVIIVGHSFATHYLQDSWHVCCVCLQWTHECSLVWHYHVGFTLKSLWKVDYLTGPRSPVIGSKHLA